MAVSSQDRAAGVLLASACGDALGAGYEFGPPLALGAAVSMRGGNGFAPGEWTDDTSMAIAVALAAVEVVDLSSPVGLDAVAGGFLRWYRSGPNDVGLQTEAVLGGAPGDTGADLAAGARQYFAENPLRSAGNGALMRTAPVALATLGSAADCARAAVAVGGLTHADPVSGEACLLWSLGIRHAVLHGTFDGVRGALALLPAERAAYWAARLDEAERLEPADFAKNGWVVQALQGAWSAITRTPVPADDPPSHLRLALENAVRGGRDADTVAAIAGGLLGAHWGASAVPTEWSAAVFGWPGYRAEDLVSLARQIVERG